LVSGSMKTVTRRPSTLTAAAQDSAANSPPALSKIGNRKTPMKPQGLLRNRGLRDEIDQSPVLGPAEGLEDALLASRRDCIAGERLLILVRP
jgi:hypothetical protein